MTLMVDPPSGWKYGFPKPYDPDKDTLSEMLKNSGYPLKDIDFALKYSICIGSKEEINYVISKGGFK